MRRKDKQITDHNEIIQIVDRCRTCRLAMVDNGRPYVIPISYAYTYEDNTLVLYFHSATGGRKIDILKSNPNVAFEISRSLGMAQAEHACDYTFLYESVLGEGVITFVEELSEKEFALSLLMKQYTGKEFSYFSRMPVTKVLKLTVTAFSGKAARRPKFETGQPPIPILQ